VGQKVAIVSDKPQTTRNRILGILNTEELQLVFIDTPGMHKPHHKLGEYMVKIAESTLSEVDLVLYVVDCSVPPGAGEEYILSQLHRVRTPVLLALNKIDLVAKEQLLPLISWFSNKGDFKAIIPVSAMTGENTEELLPVITDVIPEGPCYYPTEMVTDQPENFVTAEIIREKVLALTREEIPHSVAVMVEQKELRPNQVLYLGAVIFVERDSQKGILIGRGGRMLREIGKMARLELEAIFGNQVYLDLWVKVKPDWRDDQSALRRFGYE
jgi:GTP-binding protein Era